MSISTFKPRAAVRLVLSLVILSAVAWRAESQQVYLAPTATCANGACGNAAAGYGYQYAQPVQYAAAGYGYQYAQPVQYAAAGYGYQYAQPVQYAQQQPATAGYYQYQSAYSGMEAQPAAAEPAAPAQAAAEPAAPAQAAATTEADSSTSTPVQEAPSGDPYGFTIWLNTVRAAYGLGMVGYDPGLAGWAALNNAEQAVRGLGHHVMGPARRQNSGMGDVASVEAMWMASPAHQAALLDPSITAIGIAGGGAWWTFNAY